ncbi:OpgC family protein [Microbacterium sp. 1P10AE]|uniref:OpgC family protein n=1 Tax=Microbacterium sp. 1P10AE TaxID=3132286 RepID=UPI0039A17323
MAVRSVLAVVIGLFAIALNATPALASPHDSRDDVVPSTGAYFGSILQWGSDSVADQADRLGAPSALYQREVPYPLTGDEKGYLAGFFQQTAAAGSIAVVVVNPTVRLEDIGRAQAEDFVAALKEIARPAGAPLYVSFAPDMNTTWRPWGQRPDAYRAAFQTFADVVHAELPAAAMLWSPFWGGDYPYAAPAPLTSAQSGADTDGDGMLTRADDPYAPYYPGDGAVDAVGLSLYFDETGGVEARNVVPGSDDFVSRLRGTDGSGAPDFAAIYPSAQRPLVIQTAAFYSGSAPGPSELEVKSAWWRQIEAAVDAQQVPYLGAVIWQETATTRGVVGETVIDWSVTLTSDTVRSAFVNDLRASDLVLGPVRDATGSAADTTRADGIWGWIVVAAVFAVAALLVLFAARSSASVRRLVYSGPPSRDARIDLLRGLAIVFVVVNHLGLVSYLQIGTQEFIGVVSGAELFVLLSGVVLGLVYRPKLVSGGIGEVVIRTAGRSWKLYRTALVVVVLVYFLALLPFLNGQSVTTFTDQGTGAAGPGATGRVYDLYAGADRILQYPVDPGVVLDFLLLRMGPWQFNVMGLYVVLLLISPLILWALGRRWWPWVVGASVALYVIGYTTRFRLLPSQFEDSFPLLIWQLLFVLGMVGGFYRREIIAWFSTRLGRVVLVAIIAVAVALMLFSWNNPYAPAPGDPRLGLLSDNTFRGIYAALFERTHLAPGRLLNVLVLVVALYALVSAYWRPIAAATGAFLVPLGQSTLYVFVMHVFFALIVASIPALNQGNLLLGTLANILVLAALWVMVRTRFLFGVVPR